MTAVRLNRKLLLEEVRRSPDGAGGFSETWMPLGTLWAHLDAGTGRDRAAASVTLSAVPYRIILRAAAQGAPSRPRPGQRLRDGHRVFAIDAVADRDAQGRYLTCFATEELSA